MFQILCRIWNLSNKEMNIWEMLLWPPSRSRDSRICLLLPMEQLLIRSSMNHRMSLRCIRILKWSSILKANQPVWLGMKSSRFRNRLSQDMNHLWRNSLINPIWKILRDNSSLLWMVTLAMEEIWFRVRILQHKSRLGCQIRVEPK